MGWIRLILESLWSPWPLLLEWPGLPDHQLLLLSPGGGRVTNLDYTIPIHYIFLTSGIFKKSLYYIFQILNKHFEPSTCTHTFQNILNKKWILSSYVTLNDLLGHTFFICLFLMLAFTDFFLYKNRLIYEWAIENLANIPVP